MRTLETERLVLRNFTVDDAPALREIILQYQASAYAVYDHKWPTSIHEIYGIAEWFAGGDRFLAVCLKESGRLIGYVTLHEEDPADDPGQAVEIGRVCGLGYCLGFDYHGKGYATEACRAILVCAFDDLGADRVTASTAAANVPSCRLLDRLGFKRAGERTASFWTSEDGTPVEFLAYIFVLTRVDWAGAPSRA